MVASLSNTLRRLHRCDKGATLPIVGLVFLVLVVAVGLAVDYGRAQMVQSKLQASLDAAALAAATVGNNEATEAQKLAVKQREANKFMEANFPTDYMQTLYPAGGDQYITEFLMTDDGKGLSLTARGRVSTALMRIAGFDTVDVSAYTEISVDTARGGLEVVMVLDNTGSMNGSAGGETRMTALKRSAKKLVNDIYVEGIADPQRSYVGIVPFSFAVNVGNAKSPGSRWKRANATSSTAIAAPVNCIYPDNTVTPLADPPAPNRAPPSRNTNYAATDTPPSSGDTLFYNEYFDNGCGTVSMSAMSRNKVAIDNAIDAMITTGQTRIDLGAVWGWRMLSPRWRGYWAHSDPALPLPYDTPEMNKVMILLTDGRNEVYGNNQTVLDRANARLSNVCESAKQQGIVIYSITLHLNDANTQNRMRNCASTTDHYFHVAPGGSLDEVFSKIADSLANLRISR